MCELRFYMFSETRVFPLSTIFNCLCLFVLGNFRPTRDIMYYSTLPSKRNIIIFLLFVYKHYLRFWRQFVVVFMVSEIVTRIKECACLDIGLCLSGINNVNFHKGICI